MTVTTRPELMIDLDTHVQEFSRDTLVEVVFTSPVADRTITYLGKVAAGPAQKAEQSEICRKYGEERLLPFMPTYTIETTAKLMREPVSAANGSQTIETQLPPTDLIFDPTSPHYVARAIVAALPSTR